MKLLFKQRFFSWFDSYDIYYENGTVAYTVKGQLSWGHCLRIFDAAGNYAGTVREKVFTRLPITIVSPAVPTPDRAERNSSDKSIVRNTSPTS